MKHEKQTIIVLLKSCLVFVSCRVGSVILIIEMDINGTSGILG